MIENTDSNQTQFAMQEPVMEGLASYSDKVPTQDVEPKKKMNKSALIGIVGFILIVVFILLLVLIRSMSTKEKMVVDENGNVIEVVRGEIDPMLEEVYILADDLEAGDPSLNTIPFPPVDMKLGLDSVKRR